MKNALKFLMSIALAAIITSPFVSCEREEIKLADLEVTVDVSSSFTGLTTGDIYVYITNTIDNGVDSALTDMTGIALFNKIAPGTYNVSATMDLTAAEAGAASGYFESMTLNAVENNVNLIGGVTSEVGITLDGKPSGSLVIKEFYFNGSTDFSILFKDQFVEIYNNTDEVVYADGLYLASLAPSRTGTSPSDIPLALSMSEFVYASKILRVPGSGSQYPIDPGKSIVVSLNAVDYTNGGTIAGTVNLSTASFETYAIDWLLSLGRTGNTFFDINNAAVPNMDCIYLNIEKNGWFNFDVESASIAIFRADNYQIETALDPTASDPPKYYHYYAKIRVADIIDGIDMMANGTTGTFKRLPQSVDAGFNYIGGTYTGKSVRRKTAKTIDGRRILQDTNNSTNDFEVQSVPKPGSF